MRPNIEGLSPYAASSVALPNELVNQSQCLDLSKLAYLQIDNLFLEICITHVCCVRLPEESLKARSLFLCRNAPTVESITSFRALESAAM
jgi:hypothetical protein